MLGAHKVGRVLRQGRGGEEARGARGLATARDSAPRRPSAVRLIRAAAAPPHRQLLLLQQQQHAGGEGACRQRCGVAAAAGEGGASAAAGGASGGAADGCVGPRALAHTRPAGPGATLRRPLLSGAPARAPPARGLLHRRAGGSVDGTQSAVGRSPLTPPPRRSASAPAHTPSPRPAHLQAAPWCACVSACCFGGAGLQVPWTRWGGAAGELVLARALAQGCCWVSVCGWWLDEWAREGSATGAFV